MFWWDPMKPIKPIKPIKRVGAKITNGRILTKFPIKEDELQRVRELRMKLEAAKATVNQAERDLATAEDDVMRRLRAGAQIRGKLTAIVTEVSGRRSPPWKELYIDHMAAAHAASRDALYETVLGDYPAKLKEVLVIGDRPGK
jgi:hypothetical protein